jgi:hypothetical protein
MTVLGLLLGAFGLVLLNFGNAPTTSTAASEPYSSTWKATKILTVEGTIGSGPTSKSTGKAGIGVWGWRVDGTIGETSYTETWSAPILDGVSFTVPAGRRGCNIEGVDTGRGREELQLMAGCWTSQGAFGGPDTTRYSFQTTTIGGFDGIKARVNVGSGDQKTTSCIISLRNPDETECIFQSGSYSFQDVHEPGSNSRMRWLGSGTLTPLQWTVVGEINTP